MASAATSAMLEPPVNLETRVSRASIVPAVASSPPPGARCVPAFSLRNARRSASVRPPLYASGSLLPLGKNLVVGYDETPCSLAVALALSASASIFATRTFGSFVKSVATVSHTGARVLQSKYN